MISKSFVKIEKVFKKYIWNVMKMNYIFNEKLSRSESIQFQKTYFFLI